MRMPLLVLWCLHQEKTYEQWHHSNRIQFGEELLSLETLEQQGLLDSAAEQLREFGFASCRISRRSGAALAQECAQRLLENNSIDPESINLLIYAGALTCNHNIDQRSGLMANFIYPATALHYSLGLVNANAYGVSQTGCGAMMTAVRCATDFLQAHPEAQRVLVVGADVLPQGSKREIFYSLISDGACALLIDKNATKNKIVIQKQKTKGFYWDCEKRKFELIAAYFPTARAIMQELLQEEGLRPEELSFIVPHNVSLRSWQILLGLCQLPKELLFGDNIAPIGHVVAADNFINLRDLEDRNALKADDLVLLFNFGFGANWSCLLLQR